MAELEGGDDFTGVCEGCGVGGVDVVGCVGVVDLDVVGAGVVVDEDDACELEGGEICVGAVTCGDVGTIGEGVGVGG